MDEFIEQQSETMVEKALNEYPLAPLPPYFVSQVMARVARLPLGQPEPFRLQWRDTIVPAIMTIFVYLFLSLSLWLFGRDVAWLPPTPTLFSMNLDSLTTVGWLSVAIIVLAGEIGLLMWIGVSLWWDQPFTASSEP